jgi:hypothetical protein
MARHGACTSGAGRLDPPLDNFRGERKRRHYRNQIPAGACIDGISFTGARNSAVNGLPVAC